MRGLFPDLGENEGENDNREIKETTFEIIK